MSAMPAKKKLTRYARVFEYANPYESDAYALDSGHGWDRLASIAGEYQRGEISWTQAREWCDENARDMTANAAAEGVAP